MSVDTSRSVRTVRKRARVRSFSYNDPSSTSFHRALTRYENAPDARPCLRKKRRSGKSRVVLYRCILFPVMATGAVSGHTAATCVMASGQMEEEAVVAMAVWLSALVQFNDLKCQGYYWPWPQFWLMAVQMSNRTSANEPSSPERGGQFGERSNH